MRKRTCEKCGGEVLPTEDMFKKDPAYQEFKKEMDRLGIQESKSYNCTVCGAVYDENMNRTSLKIGWLEE